MILEDITHIEYSICADQLSYHSLKAYFMFTMMLVKNWTMAGGKEEAEEKSEMEGGLGLLHLKGRKFNFFCASWLFFLWV